MTAFNLDTEDQYGRQIQPVVFNTAKDGSGTWYVPLLDSSGQIIMGAGTSRIGAVSGVLKEVRIDLVVDGGIGAYSAKDVVGNEDCCITTATYITFADVARADGEYAYITGATLFNETENQAVQYDLHLFNAAPTGELRDNWPNTNPIKADIAKYLGKIEFPQSTAGGATVATTSEVGSSTVGRVPKPFKCASGSASIYGVLVTNTAYTQTAGDKIQIALLVEQY